MGTLISNTESNKQDLWHFQDSYICNKEECNTVTYVKEQNSCQKVPTPKKNVKKYVTCSNEQRKEQTLTIPIRRLKKVPVRTKQECYLLKLERTEGISSSEEKRQAVLELYSRCLQLPGARENFVLLRQIFLLWDDYQEEMLMTIDYVETYQRHHYYFSKASKQNGAQDRDLEIKNKIGFVFQVLMKQQWEMIRQSVLYKQRLAAEAHIQEHQEQKKEADVIACNFMETLEKKAMEKSNHGMEVASSKVEEKPMKKSKAWISAPPIEEMRRALKHPKAEPEKQVEQEVEVVEKPIEQVSKKPSRKENRESLKIDTDRDMKFNQVKIMMNKLQCKLMMHELSFQEYLTYFSRLEEQSGMDLSQYKRSNPL